MVAKTLHLNGGFIQEKTRGCTYAVDRFFEMTANVEENVKLRNLEKRVYV